MPTKVLDNISPYEKLFSKTPDFYILCSFGVRVTHIFVRISRANYHFAPNYVFFLDMGVTIKDTIAMTQCHKEYMSHHVVFDELQYPFAQKDGLCFPITSALVPNPLLTKLFLVSQI